MNQASEEFLDYLQTWQAGLSVLSMQDLARKPETLAICSVDLINGFCSTGVLASPRVQSIVSPVVKLLNSGWKAGIRAMVFCQDTHDPQAVEFADFAPHCQRGSIEAETIPELKALTFFDQITIIEKNSIHSGLNTGLDTWIQSHSELETFIVVGDCTDLCVYQLAMHLKLDANSRQKQRMVIIPADCVQTYDLPVKAAREIGILPHPGDLMHAIFLYHMALNGIEVVQHIHN